MENSGTTDLHVKKFDPVMVAPYLPLPKSTLQLSTIDNCIILREIANILLVYNASDSISVDPAKIIREALSKVLMYYFPLAGRLRNKENGDLEVECTGEGALFVEAMADKKLSVLRDLEDLTNPSFQQLFFSHPLDAGIEDLHLLVLQVTRFTCGGFVVGVSIHHSVCDARGISQVLKALGEMARGEIKPSLEPIWKRELLKPEDSRYLQLDDFESLLPTSKVEKMVQASIFINSETVKYMKQCIMEECNEFCSTFEVLAALAWIARTKALQIPHNETVKLFFIQDMRRSLNPQLLKGYY
ncbi:hypothetical protein KI387_025350, partial [Taxus chinensis]